jgi:hypothetical protein
VLDDDGDILVERTWPSLYNCWKHTIQRKCGWFLPHMKRVCAAKPSGTTIDDWMEYALESYREERGVPFPFQECFEVLQSVPRFNIALPSTAGQEIVIEDDDDSEDDADDDAEEEEEDDDEDEDIFCSSNGSGIEDVVYIVDVDKKPAAGKKPSCTKKNSSSKKPSTFRNQVAVNRMGSIMGSNLPRPMGSTATKATKKLFKQESMESSVPDY